MSIPTPFESTGQMTTLDEEAQFLTDLAAASPRVAVQQVGTTTTGHRLDLIRVGYPEAPVLAEVPAGSLAVIALQHGNEPSAREASLIFARDLAFTEDPTLTTYLAEHPVFIMPTTNPWGFNHAPMQRVNAQGININRDHVELATPEARAIAQVLQTVRPHVIVDVHENPAQDTRITVATPTDLHTDPWLTVAAEHMKEAIKAGLIAGGVTASDFPEPESEPASPKQLRIMGGLRHALTFLCESLNAGVAVVDRTAATRAMLGEALDYHVANAENIARVVAASRSRRAAAGLAGDPFYISPTMTLDPAPGGYQLTPEQVEGLATHLDLFGIVVGRQWREPFVSMAQEAQPVIPYLLDPRAPDAGAMVNYAGRPVAAGVKGETATWGPLRTPDGLAEVNSVHLHHGPGQMERLYPL